MYKEADIRNEETLLLGFCRLSFTDAQKEKMLELVDSVTDWNYFAYLANEHGLSALAGRNIDLIGATAKIPANIISDLRNARLQSLSRNAFLSTTLSEVLEPLNKENIKIVLLKGLALELTDYGNSGLRQMTDVDILVDQQSCIRARDVLLQNGFVSLPLKSVLHKPIIAYTGKHLPSLVKNGASIEIHHELFGNKDNDLTSLLIKKCVKVFINKQPVCTPSPQMFFIYLVKHLYRHELNNESQLRLYTDLFILLDKYGDQIINHDLTYLALKAGISDILAWKLKLLKDFWGLSFPEWVNDFIDRRNNPDSINRFVFFLKNPKNNPPLNKAIVYRQIVKEIPGLHRKILFLLGDIFPSLSFMKKRYKCNSPLGAIIHYPPRLGKLLWLFKN
jgi:hypothetical protein